MAYFITKNSLLKKRVKHDMELKRIYLDTCVWCRPFDEPSHRVTEEAEAFFRILRMVNEEEVVLDDEIDRIRGDEKREAVNELVHRAVSERIGYIPERYRGTPSK